MPKRLLSSLSVIEGVRKELRTKLSALSGEEGGDRRQLFWLFIDIVIFIMIQFLSLILLAASNLFGWGGRVLGVSVAAVALVLSVALALPVIFDILSTEELTAALTYTSRTPRSTRWRRTPSSSVSSSG